MKEIKKTETSTTTFKEYNCQKNESIKKGEKNFFFWKKLP